MKRLLVLINPSAGTIKRAPDPDALIAQVRSTFAAAAPDAQVVLGPPPDLIERATRAASEGFHAVIAGGGDGTLNAVANELADSDVAFGVLPLGTFNHFAKEMGVGLDVAEAIPALVNGSVHDLPVAEVSGRIFLNFSSLGLHVEIVQDREAQQEHQGRNKFIAMGIAAVRKIKDPPLLRVRLTSDGQSITRFTPSVIICNNPYQMKVFGVENASVADRELLNVYIAREHRPLGIARLLLRAAVGRLEQAANFEVLALKQFALFTRPGVRLSIDGELVDMRPPFHFRIRPRPLKILRPRS